MYKSKKNTENIKNPENKKAIWPGTTLLAPIPPVLVGVGDSQKPNVFTVAWTGIINSKPPKTYISVRPERYSYNFIKKSGEFTINLPSCDLVNAVDICGVKSGKKIDKFKETKLKYEKGEIINAPIVTSCPINLECRIFESIDLGSHTMFMADILNVHVNENLIDQNGRLMIEKANLLSYAHGHYFSLGKSLLSFGQSVKKKKRKSK